MSEESDKSMEMQRLTQKYVNDLSQIWAGIFNASMCQENLDKLVSHTKNFYEDLVAESLQKKAEIEKEISELYEEAKTTCRLLHTNVQLPSTARDTQLPLLIMQAELDKSLASLREELRKRREEICELLLEQESLCEELGRSPRPLEADPLPTKRELDDFRTYLEQLKNERVQKINELSRLRREIKGYLQTLDLHVNTEKEKQLLNERDIRLDTETFTELQHMRQMYGDQVHQLQEEIDSMRSKLESLWLRLNKSPATRNKFKRYTDCTQRTYDLYYAELQRCEALKSQNIKEYVQQVRAEITDWWDKTLKSHKQRTRFTHFTNNCYTDDLLALHELELEDLKSFYSKNQQIFQLYDDRKTLWDRMVALETKALDPARYNNRGGQLLKEEKERKTIASKLPKIEQQITELVHEYELREREPFFIDGENILALMSTEWDKKREEKEKMSSARRNGQTPLSKSQMLAGRTPLAMRNVSTVSLRKTPSTTNLSTMKGSAIGAITIGQKRKLNPSEKYTPSAKRSLMPALNSPSIFLGPFTLVSGTIQANQRHQKSPVKKQKAVVATTIRRRSGRLSSSGAKKRRSATAARAAHNVPKIHVTDASDGYADIDVGDNMGNDVNDTYDSFEKCIEPNSRSSTILGGDPKKCDIRGVGRPKRLKYIPTRPIKSIPEVTSARVAILPSSSRLVRTPSKPNLRLNEHERSVSHRTQMGHSPASVTSNTNRKLTTKNLPILI